MHIFLTVFYIQTFGCVVSSNVLKIESTRPSSIGSTALNCSNRGEIIVEPLK
jgi:hypothetical protein